MENENVFPDFKHFGSASPEWLGYERKYGAPPATPIGKLPAEELQHITNRGREKVSAERMRDEGLKSKVNIQTVEVSTRDGASIPVRIYRPAPGLASTSGRSNPPLCPVYIFYHGGGFLYGTIASEDATCSAIIAHVPIIVISVGYRHTPQVRYPVPYFDALDSFEWVMGNLRTIGGDPSRIIVGGVSAGASLAVSVVMRDIARQKDHRTSRSRVKGQVLCIPWLFLHPEKLPEELQPSQDSSSRFQCANAPVVGQKELDFFMSQLVPDDIEDKTEWKMGLIEDELLSCMPDTAFLIAGMDPLRDDGLLYAHKLHQKCVPVKTHIFPGLPHGFRRFNILQSSRRWDELVVENIKWALVDQLPSIEAGLYIHVEERKELEF